MPGGAELIVLSLGYEPPNGPKDFTVCLTLTNSSDVFEDIEVGELDNWALGLENAAIAMWKRIA